MGAENLNPRILSSYGLAFRRDAHQLLAWGYQCGQSQIHSDLLEEEITGIIVKVIEEKLDDPSIPRRFNHYSIDEEKPIVNEGRTGKRRRRLDIVIVSGHCRPRPKYVFEAKRLKKNGFPISEYVGIDGLQCYTKGIYALHNLEAAMIGYFQSDTAIYWENELKRKFDQDTVNELRIKQTLQKIQVLDCLPFEWVSEHDRYRSTPILIYHILLNCSRCMKE